MKPTGAITHQFVHHIPQGNELEDRVVYVSIPFATAVHSCCCGCGNEVVTPLDPNQWRLTFDGKSVSLSPSIGNWRFDCESHYWITRNRVFWAPKWSDSGTTNSEQADTFRQKGGGVSEPHRWNNSTCPPPVRRGFIPRILGRWLKL